MSEHTPGPWAAGYYKSTKGNDVYLHSEHLAVWPEKGNDEQTEQTPICLITPVDKETITDQANACAIAAVPELLELAETGYTLSTYAAAIHWDGVENIPTWLSGLRERIENYQAAYQTAIAKTKEAVRQ